MAHTFGNASAMERGASTTIESPPFTPVAGSTCLVLVLVVLTAQTRTGGAPTYAGVVLTQAHRTEIATTGAEASIEVWYVTGAPASVAGIAVIPNTGQRTIHYLMATGCAQPGYASVFDGATGTNGTSVSPSPGSITPTLGGDLVVAAHAGGHQSPAMTRTGTVIAETDHGTTASGIQYTIPATASAVAPAWTYDSVEDWGAVAVAFRELAPARTLVASPGALGLLGSATALAHGWAGLLTTAGLVDVTGAPATLRVGVRRLVAEAGAVDVAGSPAAVFLEPGLAMVPGAVTLAAPDARLVVGRVLQASPGAYTLTGPGVGSPQPVPPFDGPMVLVGASANTRAQITEPSFVAITLHGATVTARTYLTRRK